MSTFYSRLPKKIYETSARLRKAMESGEVNNEVMLEAFFKQYWSEFAAWWRKTQSEEIHYVAFALAPHNCEYFTQWVFKNKEGVLDEVEAGLTKNGF